MDFALFGVLNEVTKTWTLREDCLHLIMLETVRWLLKKGETISNRRKTKRHVSRKYIQVEAKENGYVWDRELLKMKNAIENMKGIF